MTEPITITNEALEPGMDYARLRAEGQQLIAGLAGHVWTDYNATDPGITLLETLCYAITDLSYRLGFEVQDLLAAVPGSDSSGKQFFSAGEILAVNPLTVMDYRKLLIDIKGVRNAWLEKAASAETPALYEPATASLSVPYGAVEARHQHELNGLYRVLLEPDGSKGADQVIQRAENRLRQFRNVGEDLAEVRVLSDAEVTIRAGIEVGRNADVNDVLAEVYDRLSSYLSPQPTFHTLDQWLASGRGVDDIFEGPPLDHGFLDDGELEGLQRRTEIYSADIVSMLMKIKHVTAVRNVRLSQGRQTPVEWVLKLQDPANTRPVLKPAARFFPDGDITLYSNEGAHTVVPDKDIVISKVEKRQSRKRMAAKPRIASNDLSLPGGKYRNLTEFVSTQNELPANFTVGRHGISDSADNLRQAQAKQLQAYLLVFDQLLVNYLAQLASAAEMFAVKPERGVSDAGMPPATYFAATLSPQVAGAEDIILNHDSGYQAWLDELVTDTGVDTDRMNRFLNHLLARHGQDFTHAAALYPAEDSSNPPAHIPAAVKVIPAKQRFLQDCAEMGRNRARGFNYTDPHTWDTENVSGLEKRIKRLLDIKGDNRQSLAGVEGFHMIDHILLRPVLPYGHITFEESGEPGKVLCAGNRKHGLQDTDEVGFMLTPGGSYLQSVYAVEVVDDHDFLITEDYVTPADPTIPETGIWVSELQKRESVISYLNDVSQIDEGAQLLGAAHHTTAFTVSGPGSPDAGDTVFVTGAGSGRLNGLHEVSSSAPGHFEIDVPFDPAFTAESGTTRWYRYPLYPDPFSCRVSFIFPAGSGRAAAVNGGQQFRDLVAEVIKTETPAHLTPYLYWFDDAMLGKFEADYQSWLEARAVAQSNSQKIRTAKAALQLLDWLIH